MAAWARARCSLTTVSLYRAAGLYRGIDSKLAQTVLAAAILFTTKEKLTAATRSALSRASRRAKVA